MGCREQILGRDGVEAGEEFLTGERAAIMEETLGHADGEVLEVVVGDADLPLELAACGIEGALGKRMLRELVEFAKHEAAATGAVGGITTKINRPNTCVRVGCAVAFDGIDKAVPFAEGKVQAAAHGRSAEHVAEEIQVEISVVAAADAACADDHMRLVRTPDPLYLSLKGRGLLLLKGLGGYFLPPFKGGMG